MSVKNPQKTLGKKVMDFIIGAVFIYVALAAFLFFYQRNLMYFPETDRLDPASVGAENVELISVETEDGLNLEGWYFSPIDTSKPVILWFHGNASSHGHRTYRLPEYLESGYGVLLAGYRGYGGNPGSPSEQGLYKDARAYMGWLLKQNKGVVLYGESLGTGVATQMATEFDVKALVLEAPYSSTVDIAKGTYFWLPLDILMKDQYRNIDKIASIDAPLLIIHGEKDSLIPIRFAHKLFDAAREPKAMKALPGAEHYDVYENGAALHVLEFLSNIEGDVKQ